MSGGRLLRYNFKLLNSFNRITLFEDDLGDGVFGGV